MPKKLTSAVTESDVDIALNLENESKIGEKMSEDVLSYSSHDWRKNTIVLLL